MPKLKATKDLEISLKITAKIDEYSTIRQLNKRMIARHLGFSVECFYQRRRNPDLFKIGELRKVYDYLKVPENERVGLC